jgi:septal ring factor EnvC (AmiA/AmiB activator)
LAELNISRVSAIAFNLLVLVAGLSLPALSEAQTNSTQPGRQQEVESELAALQLEIQILQQSLSAARSDHQAEQQKLKELDLSIQQSSQALRALDAQLAEEQLKLERLEVEKEQALSQLEIDQQQLAGQVNETYQLARQSRLKLVMNQDSPSELSRMLAYYEHLNRAQTARIEAIRTILAALQQVHQQIELQLAEIASAQELQQTELARKQEQHEVRQQVLAALKLEIGSSEAQLKEFENNRKDLEQLLEKLSDVLADIPSNLGEHLSVSSQKGRLPTPVKARVRKAFGQQRKGGMYWQGWVFDAQPGSEVSNIAYGRVAFADWLRGYGLMIIIDHGEGFMSLYGYNESLLWEVGDWVEPGSVIATVGTNSSGEQGLYFELRKDGKALDPASWMKR